MQERETQIIMQSLASRASSVEHGVAVVGIAVEDGCLAGAAGAFAAGGQHADAGLLDRRRGSDVSGGTVSVRSLWARCDLEGLVPDGLGEWLGDEPLHVQRARRPGGAVLLDGVEQRLGAAAVDRGVRLRVCRAGRARSSKPVLVLRPDGDAVAVGGELVEEGHGRALPAAVDESPLARRRPRRRGSSPRIGVMPMPPAMNR